MTDGVQQTRRTVLLVQYSAHRNGSAISGLSLANGLRQRSWETHVAFGYHGPMESDYQVAGHHTVIVEHKNWLRHAHPLRFARDILAERRRAKAFEALIREILPDVVYLNTAVSLAAAVAARRHGIKVVWHLRELFADVGGEMQAPAFLKPLVRWLFARLSDALIVNSRAVALNLLGARRAKSATVVPNAVEDSCFDSAITQTEARQRLGLPPQARIVGVPGTLRPVKGHLFFLRAVVDLSKRYEDLKFAITGDGEKTFVAELQAEVRRLALDRQVIFTGVLQALTTFYRACEVICVPSRSEPFGRVVIEAFASGAPVVATAVGGIPEIVDDGVNGLLVPYGDNKAMAGALDRLLTDEHLRSRLAKGAREKAERDYREAMYQERIARLVEAVVL